MSHEEQQLEELEALAAIYQDEFNLITDITEGLKARFTIFVESDDDEEDDPNLDKYNLDLQFILPKNYPDEAPIIEIVSSENLEGADELDILDDLNDMIPDNLGTVMVFTLASYTFEWINKLKNKKKLDRIEEFERLKREHEEREHKKFEGTIVTVESFITWKLKFDQELIQLKKIIKVENQGKLTGKEMFLRDKNLVDSDLNFADIGNEDEAGDIDVDESLFLNEDLEVDS